MRFEPGDDRTECIEVACGIGRLGTVGVHVGIEIEDVLQPRLQRNVVFGVTDGGFTEDVEKWFDVEVAWFGFGGVHSDRSFVFGVETTKGAVRGKCGIELWRNYGVLFASVHFNCLG